MPELPAPFDARTAASTAFLRQTFLDLVARIANLSDDAASACTHVGQIATGGKHLRAALVHIGADRNPDTPPERADVAVAAAFDLLHAAFLVLDDVIDADETRRGEPTIHADVRDRSGDAHYGNSVAILAGTAALNEASRLIINCGAPAETILLILRQFIEATADSMLGEFMDIQHSLPTAQPSNQLIELASRLKTSTYSFEAPLACGALLAKSPERVPHLTQIGRRLGSAYQLADDLQSIYGSTETTGKDPAGDIVHHRATPLIACAKETDAWPEIAQAIADCDIPTVQKLLRSCGAVDSAIDQAEQHLHHALQGIATAHLSPVAQVALREVVIAIQESLYV